MHNRSNNCEGGGGGGGLVEVEVLDARGLGGGGVGGGGCGGGGVNGPTVTAATSSNSPSAYESCRVSVFIKYISVTLCLLSIFQTFISLLSFNNSFEYISN